MSEMIVKLNSDKVKLNGCEYVQDLVRCGECKKWFEYDGVNFCHRTRCTAKADDFCSYGERSE